MNYTKRIPPLLLALGLVAATAAAGRSETPPPKPTLTKALSPSALRLAVLNGVVDITQNSRQATIALEWEALPRHESLLDQARAHAAGHQTFTIPNSKLGDGTWHTEVQGDARVWLQHALRIPDLKDFKQTTSDTAFQQYWLTATGAGYQAIKANVRGLEAAQVFGLNRDHNMLTTILGSKGLNYTIAISGAELKDQNGFKNNLFNSANQKDRKDPLWIFDVFRFAVGKDANGQEIAYYRFTARARMAPRTLVFPGATATEAEVKVGVSLIDSPTTAGLAQTFFQSKGIKTELTETKRTELENLASHTTSLDTVLKFTGSGVGTTDLVTRGLLGGTRQTSIITGGLVGKNTVDQLFGVNTEFRPTEKVSPGVLFGVSPDDSKSLFVGPSVRLGIFTLSAGFKSFEATRKVKQGTTTVDRTNHLLRPAGVISIDLSRATGSKKPAKIELENASAGGGWGVASEALFAESVLVSRTLTVAPQIEMGDRPRYGFTLVQTHDKDGKAIEEPGDRARIFVTLDQNLQGALATWPRGRYEYADINLPPGFGLYGNASIGQPIMPGKPFQFSTEGINDVFWFVRP